MVWHSRGLHRGGGRIYGVCCGGDSSVMLSGEKRKVVTRREAGIIRYTPPYAELRIKHRYDMQLLLDIDVG